MGIFISSVLLFFCAFTHAAELKWTGDIRIRESVEKEHQTETHWSTRLRTRLGVEAQLNEYLRAEFRLASAKSNRSNNQKLGDKDEPGMRRRFIGLDLAYADWKPAPFARVFVGRYPQIQFRPGGSEVILDDDLTMEGGGLSLEHEVFRKVWVFGHVGSSYIRENYDNYYFEDMADNMLNYGQLGVYWDNHGMRLTVGAGFYNFTSVQGKNFSDLVAGGDANGNTEAAPGVVKNPYIAREYFIDAKLPIGKFDFGTYFQYVQNKETTDPNEAAIVGFSIGQKKWDFQAAYTEIESDAVMGLFTNSDFGDGVTDVRGFIGSARWKFARNMSFKVTHFNAHTAMSKTQEEYKLWRFDLNAWF